MVRTSAGYEKMNAFADAIGVEHETYRRYERAETEPGLATLARIRRVTGVSLDFLVAGDLQAAGQPIAPAVKSEPAAAAQKPSGRRPFTAAS